jgi:ABC-type nitrate/sulfonate/bicarbonate transport system substrate-binding protein
MGSQYFGGGREDHQSCCPRVEHFANTLLRRAKDRGYYVGEGLDVELVVMSARVSNLALIAGNIEFSGAGTSGLVAGIQGAPIQLVFTSFTRPMHWLYSRPDIRQLKDLKGRKVAVDGFGGAVEYLLKELLRKHDFDPGMTVLGLGVASTRYAALLSGSVDASMLTFPYNVSADEAGFYELVSYPKEDIVQLSGNVMARRDFLQTNSELAERFVRSTMKGLMYVRGNRSGTVPIIARTLKVKEHLAAKIYDLAVPGMTADGTITKDLQEKAVQSFVKTPEDKKLVAEKLFNYSLAQKFSKS